MKQTHELRTPILFFAERYCTRFYDPVLRNTMSILVCVVLGIIGARLIMPIINIPVQPVVLNVMGFPVVCYLAICIVQLFFCKEQIYLWLPEAKDNYISFEANCLKWNPIMEDGSVGEVILYKTPYQIKRVNHNGAQYVVISGKMMPETKHLLKSNCYKSQDVCYFFGRVELMIEADLIQNTEFETFLSNCCVHMPPAHKECSDGK